MMDVETAQTILDSIPVTVCACFECQTMCNRPCWPTPAEAKALVAAGYEDRLMTDHWVMENEDVYILCPAVPGYEGIMAPHWPTGGCTFQEKDRRCELHSLGLKPTEGRLAGHGTSDDLHEAVAAMWNTDEGRELTD